MKVFEHKAAPGQTNDVVVPGILHRKCACGQHTGGGQCDDCKKRDAPLQRHPAGGFDAREVPPIVHDVLRSPGQPLDAETLAFMEPRFGQDFSRVRVHTDSRAAESARAVNAFAYTVGRNIVFGPQFSPSDTFSRQLMAHELTHVVQQENAGLETADPLKLGVPHDHSELEADVVGQQVISGVPRLDVSRVTPTLARKPAGDADADLAKARAEAEKNLPAKFPASGVRVIGPNTKDLSSILSMCTGIPLTIDKDGVLARAQGPIGSKAQTSATAQTQLQSLLTVPHGIIVDTDPAALGVVVGAFGQLTPGYQQINVANVGRLAAATGVGGGISACDAVLHEMTEAAAGRKLSLTGTSMVREKAFKPAHAEGTKVETSIRKELKLSPRSTKETGDTQVLGNESKSVLVVLESIVFGEGKNARTQFLVYRCKVVPTGSGEATCNDEVVASTVVKGVVHFTTKAQARAVFNKNASALGLKPLAEPVTK